MKYLLKRNDDGKYVAKEGSKNSYTRDLSKACVFDEAELERHQCGNETAIPCNDISPTH